jgi:hypothetical protein
MTSFEQVDQSGRLLIISSRQVVLVIAAAILVTSMTIFIFSAIGGVRYTLVRSNPLAHYGSLLPGQPASILARYGCQKAAGAENANPRLPSAPACTIFPRDEQFHLIQVSATADRITEIRLFSDNMQPEWLFASWGQPDSMERSPDRRAVTLKWDRGLYLAAVTVLQDDHVARIIRLDMKT